MIIIYDVVRDKIKHDRKMNLDTLLLVGNRFTDCVGAMPRLNSFLFKVFF